MWPCASLPRRSPGVLSLRLLAHAEQPYPPDLRARVLSLFQAGESRVVLGKITPGPNYRRLITSVVRAAKGGDACNPTRTIRLKS